MVNNSYPLVMTNITRELENHHRFLVVVPINNMVMFHSFLDVYQRVQLDMAMEIECEVLYSESKNEQKK
jgi:hypothetical protein